MILVDSWLKIKQEHSESKNLHQISRAIPKPVVCTSLEYMCSRTVHVSSRATYTALVSLSSLLTSRLKMVTLEKI